MPEGMEDCSKLPKITEGPAAPRAIQTRIFGIFWVENTLRGNGAGGAGEPRTPGAKSSFQGECSEVKCFETVRSVRPGCCVSSPERS